MDKITVDGIEYGIDMTLQGGECCIGIGKGTIRALGIPTHITIKISDNSDALSIQPCDEKNIMAFKVPAKLLTDHHCVMRIHSKRFVHGLMKYNNMDVTRTYILSGDYIQEKNQAVFSLVDNVTMKPPKKSDTASDEEQKGDKADA